MVTPIRVALVADDPKALISQTASVGDTMWGALDVVFAGPPQEALSALGRVAVDAVVLGPTDDAAAEESVRQRVQQNWPSVRLLWATSPRSASSVLEALDAGITGVLLLPTTPLVMTAAVEAVVRGGLWVDPGAAPAILESLKLTLNLEIALRRDQALRDHLRELVQGLTEVASLTSVDEMLPAVVELAQRITHAEYAALAVLDDQERIASFITRGISDELKRAIGSLPHGHGLLGEVIHTRRPLRVPHIQQHPASQGWPAAHPPMDSFLGMPMLFQDTVVGHLYCTNRRDGEFTRDDEELLALLAGHAAVLIHMARLAQELEVATLAEERQRISMDLHDGTLQALYGVILGVDTMLARDLSQLDVRAVLEDVADHLTGIIQSIRHTVQGLRERPRDLREALEAMLTDLSARDVVSLQYADALYRRLDSEQVDQVLGWTREAVSNALRHAGASHIDVTWQTGQNTFWVSVVDDGRGFDPAADRPQGHFGLSHLEERATRLGGRLTLDSVLGRGTRLSLEAPWIRPEQRAVAAAAPPAH